jgi:hypothetical protein
MVTKLVQLHIPNVQYVPFFSNVQISRKMFQIKVVYLNGVYIYIPGSRGSSVSIVTGVRFLTGAMKGYFLFGTTVSRPALGPTQPLEALTPGREADNSPPSIDVKNAWKYTSTPPYV